MVSAGRISVTVNVGLQPQSQISPEVVTWRDGQTAGSGNNRVYAWSPDTMQPCEDTPTSINTTLSRVYAYALSYDVEATCGRWVCQSFFQCRRGTLVGRY